MEKAFGYSQMKFNYITDYVNSIAESAVQMEMAWQNRKNFKEDIDIEQWLIRQAESIDQAMKELSVYLEPVSSFYESEQEEV
ncbi:hypothetical protein [Enterococcus sp. DIV1304_2]|uniref:hypothetical protein n=1 Tax=unclassified Enterococcus TaxID=2608891 RepID=UPI001E1141AD|nr:hypothetical protein [Enterococcus faecium]